MGPQAQAARISEEDKVRKIKKPHFLAIFLACLAAIPAGAETKKTARPTPSALGKPVAVKRWSAQVGLGLSSIDYSDLISTYKSLSSTLTGSGTYWLVPGRWVVGGSGYFTLLPVTRSGTGKSATMRFLGLNFRGGYVIPGVPKPWMITLMGGYYFATTFVSTNEFGYSGLSGPQLYPNVRYLTRSGNQVTGYLKFSPIASGFALLSFSNREVAAGGSYIWTRPGVALNLDFSDLALSYTTSTGGILQATSRTFSLGVSKLF